MRPNTTGEFMEIKVVEAPPAPPKKKTPKQIAAGSTTFAVLLDKPITLLLDGSILVTYSIGWHQAPSEIANALFAQGAERVGPDGCFIKREKEKPAKLRYPNPFGGNMRFNI
jgi:hypothetical protein